jgi:hypothetical protein
VGWTGRANTEDGGGMKKGRVPVRYLYRPGVLFYRHKEQKKIHKVRQVCVGGREEVRK